MSSENQFEITRDKLDVYLKEVAKEYRKQAGKSIPAELILIGGASVLINYGFRNMTTNVDALIQASSVMTDAINRVGDRYGLPNGWLNSDFTRTESYSTYLSQYSEYYKTFSNVVTIRTISAEYLIAMKLRSGRLYKRDLSDVLGILAEHEKSQTPISLERIRKAVVDLYGSWDALSEASQTFIENVMTDGHFEAIYSQVVDDEDNAKVLLKQFENDYPGVTNESNADTIVNNLQHNNRSSVRAFLREQKARINQTDSKEKDSRNKDDLDL